MIYFCSIKDVIINPDGSCGNGWVGEHRWKAIAGMASFSKAVKGTDVGGWWVSGNQAAWRGGFKGFIALTNQVEQRYSRNFKMFEGV